jgi:hypothetical protein
MISEQVLELLTAYVDGELSQRQRKAVMRLLHRSSEARQILRQLQENAHKLKQLPRHKVEPSLVKDVLQAIVERQTQPRQTLSKARRRRWLPYVAASMAASLLIGTISFLYWKNMIDSHDVPKDESFVAKIDVPEKKTEPLPAPTPRKAHPLVDRIVKGTFGEFNRPLPPPFSTTFADLQNGKRSDQLTRELKSEKAIQLDITVKNNPDALFRLKDVLRERKIDLVTDASAAKTLKTKNQEKVVYLVYAENVTTDELTKLMNELSQSYVIGLNNTERKMTSPYKNVTVTPIAEDDKQKLAKLLGDPVGAKSPSKAERKAVVLPVTANGAPSSEVARFAKQRSAPQPGTLQVLIRIRQE